MKKLFLFLLIVFAAGLITENNAQEGKHRNQGRGFGQGAREKIEALEKAKLIEELNMSEDLSIKFFARRKEHIDRVQKYDKELDAVEDNLEKALNEGKNDQALKKLLAEHHTVQNKIANERGQFINSLSGILSTKQLAKFIVFENKFKEEVRNILMRERNKRTQGND